MLPLQPKDTIDKYIRTDTHMDSRTCAEVTDRGHVHEDRYIHTLTHLCRGDGVVLFAGRGGQHGILTGFDIRHCVKKGGSLPPFSSVKQQADR